ncbi:hypothetical protein [Labrys wisconsinensis]|uniref:Uncharacterized protein n=1 Tax=Labrys wisconsinensis TaxID=425677 RepID=A0ABU0J1D3_9HYPH|nr:hypothetical protein [Labrys wisconsinensis]MDQ0468048.1 hypothetical protein [Labrys wisconsinensis]
MIDPYFCKLYIDTDELRDDLQRSMDYMVKKFCQGIPVEAPVLKNEDFDASFKSKVPYRFIECSRYYAEVGTIDDEPRYIAGFQAGMAALVKALRQGNRTVTVACDFEDMIEGEAE